MSNQQKQQEESPSSSLPPTSTNHDPSTDNGHQCNDSQDNNFIDPTSITTATFTSEQNKINIDFYVIFFSINKRYPKFDGWEWYVYQILNIKYVNGWNILLENQLQAIASSNKKRKRSTVQAQPNDQTQKRLTTHDNSTNSCKWEYYFRKLIKL